MLQDLIQVLLSAPPTLFLNLKKYFLHFQIFLFIVVSMIEKAFKLVFQSYPLEGSVDGVELFVFMFTPLRGDERIIVNPCG